MKFLVNHLHFVGIGGAGMSGIAEVLLNLGYVVSGSDIAASPVTERLQSLGARISLGHDKKNIRGADAVIVSSAVKADNPEVTAARELDIPVVPRAVMLAELMRLRRGIAIAGAHGKTTTTSLTASLLAAGGLDPTFVIGGKLNSAGANARLGTGEFLVAEADESDASFLNLTPVIAAVTNIDEDHMDTYGHDFEKLKSAFVDFLGRLPFYGVAVLCMDDDNVRSIRPRVTKPVIGYGLSHDATVRAIDVTADGTRMRFTVLRPDHPPLPVVLNLPGVHNVRNALAAVAIATLAGVKDEDIKRGLAEFKGVGRRFAQWGDIPIQDADGRITGTFTLIDDYGHHPHEMAATLAAVRGAWPGRRIVVAFQPHRYTRTRDCFNDFVKVLEDVDGVVLANVYPAGEAPIPGADSHHLAEAIKASGRSEPVVADVDQVPDAVRSLVEPGDVVVTMGAAQLAGRRRNSPVVSDGIKNRSLQMTQAEEPRLERVVVLEGGISSEREVSLLSGRGVKEALASKGLEVESWDPAVDSVGGLEEGAYDAAFIALHGTLGEDGSVQGLLNCIGLPYTGPGVTASAIAMDKELTKNIWRANGISVPAGVRLTAAASDAELERAIAEFGADGVVVKPGHDGSSIGVTKLDRDALSLHSLRAALNAAAERDAAEVLVEEYIHGREFTVAILDGKALPVIEICAPEGSYDFQNKYYTDVVRYECPAKLPEASAKALAAACEKAFAVLGCRGWSRVDALERADGTFALLEINTSPGMTPHSLVPMAARAVGLSYADLCLRVLGLARTDIA